MTGSREITDAELIRRANAGDMLAFQGLVEQTSPAIRKAAWTFCHDHQTADDLAQETFLEAWKTLSRFDGRCRFSTWLYGILRHRYLKLVRRLGGSKPPYDSQFEEPVSTRTEEPDSQLEHAELAAQLQRAVMELPEEHRAVIELRFFADAGLEEIAQALGIPLGTVKSRLHHGLEKLRKSPRAVNLFANYGESPARQP